MTQLNRSERTKARVLFDRIRSEPGLFRNVAILLVLIVLGSVATGIILSNQRFTWPWEDRFVFSATFTEAPAISPGNGQEVRIAGVAVGEITDASARDGEAVLELSIDPAHQVYDNARVVLRPKSPLNEMYVELNPGTEAGEPVAEGAVLPVANSRHPVQIDQVLQHLDENARSALTSLLSEADVALASAPSTLPDGLAATSGALTELRPVVDSLRTRKESLAQLVTALGEISAAVGDSEERLARVASALQQTLRSVNGNSEPLDDALAQLPDLTGQVTAAMDGVRSLTGELDPALDNLREASGVLPGALDRLTDTVDQVDETVDEATPVVAAARPLVRDLRPLVGDVHAALPDLLATTSRLDRVTKAVLPYLDDLGAFVTNTRSVTSLTDANGGILRGMLEFTPSTLPLNLPDLSSAPTPR